MSSTLRSSAHVGAAILVSRVLGVVRDSIFARAFGVSGLTDAYVAAFRIPNLLRDLFAEGALSSAFVPTFSDALNRGGREGAYRLGNLVLGVVLAVTGTLTLGGMLFSDQLVSLIARGFGGNAAQVALGGLFTHIMMPILTLVSVSAVWMGMLNAQHHYMAPAYAPAMFNVTSILCGVGLLIAHPSDRTGMVVWSLGTTLSGLVQAVVQLPSLWRLGYRVRPTLAGLWRDSDLLRIARLMGPATLGLAAVQINIFVNTQFAAALGSGPLTYLQNAFRLFYLPVGLFGVALATVTTARASQEAARGDRPALQARVAEGARGVWLLALPSAVGLIVLARPVVELLFQGGKFSAANTAATVPIVQAYMLGVLPYSLVKVLSPAFFAVDRPRIPMLASMTAVAVNLAFNGLTYRHLGAAGLALGTTVGALANLAVLRIWFGQVVGRSPRLGRWHEILRLILCNLVMAAVAIGAWWLCAWLLNRAGLVWPWGTRRLVHAILLFATIGVGFASYGVGLKLLRLPGADELWDVPRRILAKLRGRR
ncbi:MAG TPA: murein biosynthesis integral membrane protein MurJ [Polyangia bacterium]